MAVNLSGDAGGLCRALRPSFSPPAPDPVGENERVERRSRSAAEQSDGEFARGAAGVNELASSDREMIQYSRRQQRPDATRALSPSIGADTSRPIG